MLHVRRYGRLASSLSTRHVRYATAAVAPRARKRAPKPTALPEPTKSLAQDGEKTERPKGLREIQARLEATGYSRRKNAAILKPKKDVKPKTPEKAKSDAEPERSAESQTEAAAAAVHESSTPSRNVAATRKPTSDAGAKAPRKPKPKSDADVEPPTKAKTKAATADKSPTPSAKMAKRQPKKLIIMPPRLMPPIEQKHHDLASFLAHAEFTKANTKSTTYVGTHFEYTVAQSLLAVDFTLQRTGRANDLGIDLIGHWALPAPHSTVHAHTMPVIIQCKASKTTPAEVRELEGAYAGAPAGWRGPGVLAMLVSTRRITKGVLEAVQRSRWPMAVMHMQREGVIKQLLWNAVADEKGLEGLSVAARYTPGDESKVREGGDSVAASVERAIMLTWMGKLWRPVEKARVEGDARDDSPTEPEMVEHAVA
ncbi:hypothetical protein LTR08_008892 [Meristemomyces frigidus]|nr:hypothetical protein LTR08_008892 [Meristemomyces frigidus]